MSKVRLWCTQAEYLVDVDGKSVGTISGNPRWWHARLGLGLKKAYVGHFNSRKAAVAAVVQAYEKQKDSVT